MNADDYLREAHDVQSREDVDPWMALMRVLTRRVVSRRMPSALAWASTQAVEHWARRDGDLVTAKAEVWRYIDALQPHGAEMATEDGRTARALLCVLDASGGEESRHDVAAWFSSVVDGTN